MVNCSGSSLTHIHAAQVTCFLARNTQNHSVLHFIPFFDHKLQKSKWMTFMTILLKMLCLYIFIAGLLSIWLRYLENIDLYCSLFLEMLMS